MSWPTAYRATASDDVPKTVRESDDEDRRHESGPPQATPNPEDQLPTDWGTAVDSGSGLAMPAQIEKHPKASQESVEKRLIYSHWTSSRIDVVRQLQYSTYGPSAII